MDKEFNCWKCTACCRLCDKIEELKEFDAGDGTCVHLSQAGDCLIYETRPDVCNTRTQYEKTHATRLTWNQYVDYGEIICKILEKNLLTKNSK